MSLPRSTAWIVTAAAVGVLTGCSSDDAGGDADAAHTTACRTYLLGVAGQDTRVTVLLNQAALENSWNNEPINTSLEAVREAAKQAGLVEGLSDDDFEVYGALVEAVGTAYSHTNPAGGAGISTATSAGFQEAAQAVRDSCEAD